MFYPVVSNRKPLLLFSALAGLGILTACTSSGGSGSETASTASQSIQSTPQAQTVSAETASEGSQLALVSTQDSQAAASSGAICNFQLAGGPPPKPARGADFGSAVGKNLNKGVQRGILTQIGGRLAGGLGAQIANNVSHATIRNEEDIKGVWKIVDGKTGCGCQVSVDSLLKLAGKGADNGTSRTLGCQSPEMQRVATWALGYSFAGYDAKFELKASDKRTVLATMNRDGIHYFSGTFANGTPVVMWRESQNYNQLASFNKQAKAGN